MTAWRPAVQGLAEVFHAHLVEHAYPTHTHQAWTLLIIDDGVVRFSLDRHAHSTLHPLVTLLPPHVPHDGSAATTGGFRKRVLYVDEALLGSELIGAAVDRPGVADPMLRQRIHQLHEVLASPGEELEARSRLALVVDRLQRHLRRTIPVPASSPDRGLARRLRELLDARTVTGLILDEAANLLSAHPAYLVRAFSHEYGIPPHQYLTGRRIDLARGLLLSGQPPAEVAVAVGFYDQSHLTRHFRRLLGVTPARYAKCSPR